MRLPPASYAGRSVQKIMKRQKSKKPAWIDVKRSVKDIENSNLIELLKDLYELSDENKNFLHARFLAGSSSLIILLF